MYAATLSQGPRRRRARAAPAMRRPFTEPYMPYYRASTTPAGGYTVVMTPAGQTIVRRQAPLLARQAALVARQRRAARTWRWDPGARRWALGQGAEDVTLAPAGGVPSFETVAPGMILRGADVGPLVDPADAFLGALGNPAKKKRGGGGFFGGLVRFAKGGGLIGLVAKQVLPKEAHAFLPTIEAHEARRAFLIKTITGGDKKKKKAPPPEVVVEAPAILPAPIVPEAPTTLMPPPTTRGAPGPMAPGPPDMPFAPMPAAAPGGGADYAREYGVEPEPWGQMPPEEEQQLIVEQPWPSPTALVPEEERGQVFMEPWRETVQRAALPAAPGAELVREDYPAELLEREELLPGPRRARACTRSARATSSRNTSSGR